MIFLIGNTSLNQIKDLESILIFKVDLNNSLETWKIKTFKIPGI